MEAALELDDDVFFADLSRQISLLIMDDDDHDAEDYSISSHYSSANLQRLANTFAPPSQASYLSYDHHHHHQQHASKREIKGTGVFIPLSSHHRRNNNNNNNKQGKSAASANNKFLRPYDQNSRGLIFPQMNYNNTNSNSTCEQSFNVRRF